MIAYHEIAARLFNTPLLVDAGKAAAIVAGLGERIIGAPIAFYGAEPVEHPSIEAARLGDVTGRNYDAAGRATYERVGPVAVIPIEGSLVHKGNYVGALSGRTSYQGLQAAITRAGRDPSVKGVVFEVDSMGGEVAGMFETADLISRLSAEKPTMSIVTDSAYSAAYALASGARQIVAPDHGGVGSIGAIMLHADMSGKLSNEGVKVTVLRAGARKAEGNPVEPLSEDAAAAITARLEAVREDFADMVGRNRGTRFSRKQAMMTEAAGFSGRDAVTMGMVDAVGSPTEAFDLFIRKLS